jgi:NAD(P)-dependent dehydrogenase (short-subunit alcohol dehydrogenase family)
LPQLEVRGGGLEEGTSGAGMTHRWYSSSDSSSLMALPKPYRNCSAVSVTARLVASGAQVITGAQRSSAEIEALTRDKQVIFAEVDLADPAGPAQLVAMAGDRVDVLVNNVGSARARLSKEVGSLGIRVNTVSPGPVATDLWLGSDGVASTVSQATGAKPGDVESQAAAGSVTGRFSQPAEVADPVKPA